MIISMNPLKSTLASAAAVLVLVAFTSVGHAGEPAKSGKPASTQQDNDQPPPDGVLPLDELRTFADVFNHIRLSYVEKVDDKTLLEYAIRGMLENLDPHSAYLDSKSFDDLQVSTSGEFGGLGLEVGMENGFIKVISPIDGTPAAKAGIESGDLIIKLDGKPVKGLSLNDAVSMMRGKKGSKIELTIVREGLRQPFDLTLTRDTITVASVRGRMLEKGYAYIRIAQFQNKTGQEFDTELKKLQKGGHLSGLIIDLRNNPGGILQASVQVADALLDKGLIVYTEGRLPSSRSEFSATPGDMTNGTPVVVLINGGTASASEIVSGALQDHKRAVIMGTKSFGKGSVQTVVPLSKDHAIKLTTARYYTPSGRSIQAQGITPDIIVERAKIEAIAPSERITEADLNRHLGSSNGKESTSQERKSQVSKEELFNRDNQLYEALNLLKGLNIISLNRATPTPAPTTAAAAGGEK